MTLHLVLVSGSISLVLALSLSEQGKWIFKGAWSFLKKLFVETLPSLPWKVSFHYRKRTHNGDETEITLESHGTETRPAQQSQENQTPAQQLLAQLPGAMGGEPKNPAKSPANAKAPSPVQTPPDDSTQSLNPS